MKLKGQTYQPVIGLEVHIQLNTKSKIFAPDHNRFGDEPNRNLSAITIAHPGTLPLLNIEVVKSAVKMGIALNCEINSYIIFDRKNYFYPDLPKGYQLTQDTSPICIGGGLEIKDATGKPRFIFLTKIHMEEDAGKSIHVEEADHTNVDLNRSGVPLIEIVTEPVLTSSSEAIEFLMEIRRIARYLKISDGNMEEGSLRCDANVSIRKPGGPLGQKVELKNMNSFRNVGKAIEHEIGRQEILARSGKDIISESRSYDPATGGSVAMRTKEILNDYRYFPEPDISPVKLENDWIEEIRVKMPSLPNDLKKELVENYALPAYDAEVLVEDKGFVDFFFQVAEINHDYKQVSNWIMGPVKKEVNKLAGESTQIRLSPKQLSEILTAIENSKISKTAATQKLFPYMWDHPEKSVNECISLLDLGQEGDENEILTLVNEILDANPEKVKAYHSGKKGLTGMFMGELMKKSAGKVDPRLANQLIVETLENRR